MTGRLQDALFRVGVGVYVGWRFGDPALGFVSWLVLVLLTPRSELLAGLEDSRLLRRREQDSFESDPRVTRDCPECGARFKPVEGHDCP